MSDTNPTAESSTPPGRGADIRPAGRSGERPLYALGRRLRDLARRAGNARWSSWSQDATCTVERAARELEAFEEAFAEGMREAFTIGRQYGKGEDALDRLNEEIARVSGRLARQAWGTPEPGDSGEELAPDA